MESGNQYIYLGTQTKSISTLGKGIVIFLGIN